MVEVVAIEGLAESLVYGAGWVFVFVELHLVENDVGGSGYVMAWCVTRLKIGTGNRHM